MIALAILLASISMVKCNILGPADVIIQRVEKCSEDSMGVTMDHLWHKVNRTTSGIDLDWTLPFPMDEKVGVNFTSAKWGDGGWKPGALDQYRENACTNMLQYYPSFKEYLSIWGQPIECPLQAGTYSLKNYVIDTNLDYPLMYGDFRCDIFFDREKSVFSCIRMFLKITPKGNKFG